MFYVSFSKLKLDGPDAMEYRCSGINALHKCQQDHLTFDRYPRYRNRDPKVRQLAAGMLDSGIRAGNIANYINKDHNVRIQAKDIHRIHQTERKKIQSLENSTNLSRSDVQELVEQIKVHGDRYRIKFIGDSQVMQYLFYWDPSIVQLARSFCQVVHYKYVYNFRSCSSTQHLKTITNVIH